MRYSEIIWDAKRAVREANKGQTRVCLTLGHLQHLRQIRALQRAERRAHRDQIHHIYGNGDAVAAAAIDERQKDQKAVKKMANKAMADLKRYGRERRKAAMDAVREDRI